MYDGKNELDSREFQRLRSTGKRGFEILISSETGSGTIHPPKSIVERLNRDATLYEPLLVESTESLRLIIPLLVKGFPAFIYVPILCNVQVNGQSCNIPVSENAYKRRIQACESHYKMVSP